MQAITSALADIGAGIRLHRVWVALAHEDIGDQHRRTTLGPLWLLVNYLALIAVFILLFQRGGGTPHYASYAATGLLVWYFISEVLGQAVTLFVREESMIKGTLLPLSIYVMRLVMQSTIRMAYALVGCLIILVVDGAAPSAAWLWILPGLLVIFCTAPAAAILLAFLGAYFPDSQYLVSNLMRIGMFATPVFWLGASAKGLRSAFYHLNPFSYFLELVRLPLLEDRAPFFALGVCTLIGLGLWAASLPLLGRFRKRVVYVL